MASFLRVTYCSATSHILLLYVGECRDVRPWAALPEDPIGVGAHIDRRIGLRLAILGIGACGAQILGSPRYLQKRSSNQGADRLLSPWKEERRPGLSDGLPLRTAVGTIGLWLKGPRIRLAFSLLSDGIALSVPTGCVTVGPQQVQTNP